MSPVSRLIPKVSDGKTGITRTYLPLVFTLLLSIFVAIYGESFYEICRGYYSGNYNGLIVSSLTLGVFVRTVLLFIISFLIFLFIYKYYQRIFRFTYKFRYPLALLILAFFTTLEISGSSVACWIPYLNETAMESGTLFGIPRAIRSDEWLVNLPTFLSQAFNDYASSSAILRGAETNTTMPTSAPSWSLATFFHPFQWGYLLFGTAKGVAFDWTSSKLALILVSFECAMLYTRRNKMLSAAAAVMLSFSPLILWWNTGSVLIFGQGLVLSLYHFLHSNSIGKRVFISAIMAWLAGCYLMLLYPAWQVPFFFIFSLFGIWVVMGYRKETRTTSRPEGVFAPKRDLAILVLSCIAVTAMLLFVFFSAADALLATTSTAYPSGRISTGGNLLPTLFSYGSSLILPLSLDQINSSELSTMFTLFPIGFVAGCIRIYKSKGKDVLTTLLVVLEAVFLLYGILGFPEWLSRITLFSHVPTARLLFPLGSIDIILVIRAISQTEKKKSLRKASYILPVIVSFVIYALCLAGASFEIFFAGKIALFIALILVVSTALASLTDGIASSHRCFVASVCVVLLVSGVCVNPIQKGLGPLVDNELYSTVEEISSTSNGELWLAEDSIALGNFCIAAGAPTINSVNAYPNLERWQTLDPEGNAEQVYNRYAHIVVSLSHTDTVFTLIQDDAFRIDLNWGDLQTLDVKYLITPKDHPQNPTENIELEPEAKVDGYNIYKIKYLD